MAGILLCVLVAYTLLRAPFQFIEVIRIPLIEYGLVFVFYGIWWSVARVTGRLQVKRTMQESAIGSRITEKSNRY